MPKGPTKKEDALEKKYNELINAKRVPRGKACSQGCLKGAFVNKRLAKKGLYEKADEKGQLNDGDTYTFFQRQETTGVSEWKKFITDNWTQVVKEVKSGDEATHQSSSKAPSISALQERERSFPVPLNRILRKALGEEEKQTFLQNLGKSALGNLGRCARTIFYRPGKYALCFIRRLYGD